MPRLLGTLHAAEHAMIALLPLWAMCDRWDIGGLSTNVHFQTGRPTIFVYDGHPGGVGLTKRGYDAVRGLGGGHCADAGRLPVRARLPLVRPVAEVREPERAARQAGRADPPRAHAGRPVIPLELRTERLLLRQWRDEDVEPLATMNSQPEYLEHMPSLDLDAIARPVRAVPARLGGERLLATGRWRIRNRRMDRANRAPAAPRLDARRRAGRGRVGARPRLLGPRPRHRGRARRDRGSGASTCPTSTS